SSDFCSDRGNLEPETAVLNGRLRASGSMEAFVAIERARLASTVARAPISDFGQSGASFRLQEDARFRELETSHPHMARVLAQACALRLFFGAQLYVSHRGQPLIAIAFGESPQRVAM